MTEPWRVVVFSLLLQLGGCQGVKPPVKAEPEVRAEVKPLVVEPVKVAEPAQPVKVVEPVMAAEPVEAGLGPLAEGERAAVLAGAEERIFSKREHFTVSNEYRHDLWFPYLRGLGGVYLGVAADQNFKKI